MVGHLTESDIARYRINAQELRLRRKIRKNEKRISQIDAMRIDGLSDLLCGLGIRDGLSDREIQTEIEKISEGKS